jgi:peptide/nickel transport system permease protein
VSKYLFKRLGMTVLVCLLVVVFLAVMPYFIPGDPVKTILGPRASPELVAKIRSDMNLDKPAYTQVYLFLYDALHGDLGTNFVTGKPIMFQIKEALPHTVLLALSSLLLSILIGIPLGVFSAAHPDSWADRLIGVMSVSLITLPSYVAGLLLLLLFAVNLKWLPAVGAGDFSDLPSVLERLILPSFALAISWIGYLARLVRTSVLEVMTMDYIRTAYSFGLKERIIYYKYALKNAIIPTIAVLGVGLGNLLGGAVFVEVIFSRPGLGQLIYESIIDRNYPVVRAAVLIVAILFVSANLVADISYRLINPRAKVEGTPS